MRMKICFLGNAESVHTQRWVRCFAAKGHDIHLLSFSYEPIEDVSVHKIPKITRFRVIAFPFRVYQIRKIIGRIHPAILHVHTVSPLGIYGAFLGFHPLVLTAWGSDVLIGPKQSKLFKYVVEYALKKADCVTCDAEHMIGVLTELGVNPEKINPIYFGTDTRKFSPEQRSNTPKEELGILHSPVIISLRSLEPIYDVESLIKAVPLVLNEIPSTTFIIAGDGSQKAELKGLAESLGISDSIRFVGFIPNDELPQYLASSDVYVSTSLSDAGLAASTAEAMACGLPVIVTDFGDNSKWIKDDINGFVVPTKSPETLASKIIYLLQHEDKKREFGQAGRKVIEERNNYEREMGKMEKLYNELIERYRR